MSDFKASFLAHYVVTSTDIYFSAQSGSLSENDLLTKVIQGHMWSSLITTGQLDNCGKSLILSLKKVIFRVYCANISLTKGDHLFLNYFQVQSEVKQGHLRSRELILIYEPRGSSRGNMNLLNVFNVTIIWPQLTLFVTI